VDCVMRAILGSKDPKLIECMVKTIFNSTKLTPEQRAEFRTEKGETGSWKFDDGYAELVMRMMRWILDADELTGEQKVQLLHIKDGDNKIWPQIAGSQGQAMVEAMQASSLTEQEKGTVLTLWRSGPPTLPFLNV
jgi:hypothetical protein